MSEFLVYFLFLIFWLSSAIGIIKFSKRKDLIGLLASSFFVLFTISLFIGFISGGSALHNAFQEYELYQSGHYYLVSHGIWKEVSHGRYIFVFISEIISFLSAITTLVFSILHIVKSNSD